MERGRAIIAENEGTEAKQRWQRDTEALMRKILSENSELYKGFHKFASFTSLTAVKQGVYLLEESIRQIEEYGLISKRTQRHPLWYKLGIPRGVAAIVAVFTLPVQRFLGIGPDGEEQLTEGQREMKCEQMRVEFENQLWEFDESKTFSLDSLMGVLNGRGVLQSGPAKTFIAHFRESNQRQRDQAIDSFYLAYMLQGGDTTKLKYRR